eukprot:4581320-Prymnesium_polylepis.2
MPSDHAGSCACRVGDLCWSRDHDAIPACCYHVTSVLGAAAPPVKDGCVARGRQPNANVAHTWRFCARSKVGAVFMWKCVYE